MTNYHEMIMDLYQMAAKAKEYCPGFATHIRKEIVEIRRNWRIDQPLCACIEEDCTRRCKCACHSKQADGAAPLTAFIV